tara:strand:+ start:1017 stop:1460 length:444 start_codon:yes stop_codon:yes gene_type:complete
LSVDVRNKIGQLVCKRIYSQILFEADIVKRLSLGIFIVYSLFLLVMTHLPVEQLPPTQTSDKLLHFCAYAVQGLLVSFCLIAFRPMRWRNLIYCFLGLCLFAGIDELTQGLVGRFPEWLDWCADIAGISAGLAVAAVLQIVNKSWSI